MNRVERSKAQITKVPDRGEENETEKKKTLLITTINFLNSLRTYIHRSLVNEFINTEKASV